MPKMDTITAMGKTRPDELKDGKLFNCLYERYYGKGFQLCSFLL